MSYTPPAGNLVSFDVSSTGGYTAPAGDSVEYRFKFFVYYQPLPFSPCDASWAGAEPYTVLTRYADATFNQPFTYKAKLDATPPAFIPTYQLVPVITGSRDRDWLYSTIPDPQKYTLTGDAAGVFVHAPSLSVDFPPPDLTFTAAVTGQDIQNTRISVSLPVPQFNLVPDIYGAIDILVTVNASLPEPRYPLTTNFVGEVFYPAQLTSSIPRTDPDLIARIFERPFQAALDATLPRADPDLLSAFAGDYIHRAEAIASIPRSDRSMTPSLSFEIEIALPDPVGPKERGFRHQGMLKTSVGSAIRQEQALKSHTPVIADQQQAIVAGNALNIRSTEMNRIKTAAELVEQSTIRVPALTSVGHQEALRIPKRSTTLSWAEAIRINASSTVEYADTIKTRNRQQYDHQQSLKTANSLQWTIKEAIRTAIQSRHKWAQMLDGSPGIYWPWYEVPTITEMVILPECGNYSEPRPLHCVIKLGYGYPTQPACTEPPGPPPAIPEQRTYIVIHTISVTRLSDGLPIDVENISLSLDADAWTWGFNANLVGNNALEAVKPSALGEPITLVVAINDVTWHVIVEDWSENRSFGSRSISVSGRGLSAELADPYQLPSSGVTTQNWNVQQLMNEHLPLGSGWTITWATGMADWQVPAGAWSWQNQTPITSIHAIAQQCGMTVVPDTDTKTLHIQPRYKYMPWSFSSQTPDLVIPDSAILSYQRQNSIPAQANAVYVHGSEVGGVIGYCVKDGTAGDKVLTTYNSNLITHSDGAQLVGSRLLAGQYKQPEIRSVTMTMGGSFPLGQIGSLIKMTVENQDHYGIVNSVALQVSASNVRQTLTFGENTTNQWALFKTLLPGDPLLLGTVLGNSADGTVTVGLVDGTAIRARGTDAIGTPVWVRSGRVEGTAPNLTQHPVTIY